MLGFRTVGWNYKLVVGPSCMLGQTKPHLDFKPSFCVVSYLLSPTLQPSPSSPLRIIYYFNPADYATQHTPRCNRLRYVYHIFFFLSSPFWTQRQQEEKTRVEDIFSSCEHALHRLGLQIVKFLFCCVPSSDFQKTHSLKNNIKITAST